jgi:hypothetical protein
MTCKPDCCETGGIPVIPVVTVLAAVAVAAAVSVYEAQIADALFTVLAIMLTLAGAGIAYFVWLVRPVGQAQERLEIEPAPQRQDATSRVLRVGQAPGITAGQRVSRPALPQRATESARVR